VPDAWSNPCRRNEGTCLRLVLNAPEKAQQIVEAALSVTVPDADRAAASSGGPALALICSSPASG